MKVFNEVSCSSVSINYFHPVIWFAMELWRCVHHHHHCSKRAETPSNFRLLSRAGTNTEQFFSFSILQATKKKKNLKFLSPWAAHHFTLSPLLSVPAAEWSFRKRIETFHVTRNQAMRWGHAAHVESDPCVAWDARFLDGRGWTIAWLAAGKQTANEIISCHLMVTHIVKNVENKINLYKNRNGWLNWISHLVCAWRRIARISERIVECWLQAKYSTQNHPNSAMEIKSILAPTLYLCNIRPPPLAPIVFMALTSKLVQMNARNSMNLKLPIRCLAAAVQWKEFQNNNTQSWHTVWPT